jgi:ATP-dependent DNA helicase RecG
MKEEILYIIKQGENEGIEFKTSFCKEVIESIVAFSNTKGGKVIVGVNDNKNIAGITVSDESIQNWLNQIKQNTNPQVIPDVQTLELNNRNIVVFDVMEYPIKPVAYRNKYFKRIANSNYLIAFE